jgi:hypothetical protein
MGRIFARDVERRVCLGIAFRPGFGQCLLERDPFLCHGLEDKIGRPVQNPVEPIKPVCDKVVPYHLDQRDSSPDGRFKPKPYTLFLGQLKGLPAKGRKKRLVGRHNALFLL